MRKTKDTTIYKDLQVDREVYTIHGALGIPTKGISNTASRSSTARVGRSCIPSIGIWTRSLATKLIHIRLQMRFPFQHSLKKLAISVYVLGKFPVIIFLAGVDLDWSAATSSALAPSISAQFRWFPFNLFTTTFSPQNFVGLSFFGWGICLWDKAGTLRGKNTCVFFFVLFYCLWHKAGTLYYTIATRRCWNPSDFHEATWPQVSWA